MTALYEALGVSPKATPDQIKKAYRKLSKTAHPDAGGTVEQFQKIQEAYANLKDPDKRAYYDRTGKTSNENIDEARGQALGLLSNLLHQALNAGDAIFYEDLIAHMRNSVKDNIAKMKEQTKKIDEVSARCKKMQGRFTRKKAQDNPLESFLSGTISMLEMQKLSVSRQCEFHKLALDILSDYEFRADKRPQTRNQYTVFQNIFGSGTMG